MEFAGIQPTSFKSVKLRGKDAPLACYQNLIEVVIGNRSHIYNLDSKDLQEVEVVDDVNQLVQLDKFIDTGTNCITFDGDWTRSIRTNEQATMYFEEKRRMKREDFQYEFTTYRMHSYLDLLNLQDLVRQVSQNQVPPFIEFDTILSTYDGNTIFSIFFENIEVFRQIRK